MSAIVSRINGCNCACLRVAVFEYCFSSSRGQKKEQRKKTDWVFWEDQKKPRMKHLKEQSCRLGKGLKWFGGGGGEAKTEEGEKKRERATDHQTEGDSPGDCQ